jgi:hypothetical protein
MTIRAKAASVDLGGGVWWYRGYTGIELDASNIFIAEHLIEPGDPAEVAVAVIAPTLTIEGDIFITAGSPAEVAVAALGATPSFSFSVSAGVAAVTVAAPTPSTSVRVSTGSAAVTTAAAAATSLEEVEPEIAAVPNGAVLGTLDPSQDLTWRRDTWAPDGLVYRSYSGASFTPVRSRSPRLGPGRSNCAANNALVEVT